MITKGIGNCLSDVVMVNGISVTLTSSYILLLIAFVNLITFKNQVVSESTNFQKECHSMLQMVTILQSVFTLNLYPLMIKISKIGFDFIEKTNKKHLYPSEKTCL